MDLSTSRRRKQLDPLTRDNMRFLPNRVRVLSALRAPRSCACWDCDARRPRSAQPRCRGELDRESLFLREGFRERRSRRQPLEKTPCRRIAPEPASRRRREAATKIEHSMMGCIRAIETSSGSFPATRRRALATPLQCERGPGNQPRRPQVLQFLGCVCRLTLERTTYHVDKPAWPAAVQHLAHHAELESDAFPFSSY